MENPAIPTPTQEEIDKHFESREDEMRAVESMLETLRKFLAVYRNSISPFKFNLGWYTKPTISFNCEYYNKDQAKNIARALGPTGWKREKDSYSCGRINWKKTIDGVEVHIDGAEHMDPKLIEEVKL